VPIKIVNVPDPFTPARPSQESPPFIESDAYRQLLQELRRYCNRELAGRSFLITGHRGSGKTTLVSRVFEALLREAVRGDSELRLRPLPVLLQGPTLLPNPREDLPLAGDGTGDSGRRLSEMENVLVQITLGLHRAVAREMVLAFRAHVTRLGLVADHLNVGDMREVAAQLQFDLDDYSGKARVSEIWRRCGALTSGVLYALGPFPIVLHDDAGRGTVSGTLKVEWLPQPRLPWFLDSEYRAPSVNQGLNELLAVVSVCEAYRRISGKISRKDEQKSGATSKTESSIAIDGKGKEIVGPVIALLTGSAIGAGAAATGASLPIAGLAAALTAIIGMIAAKWSVIRTRDRSASLEDLFIPDLSVATLDRILPVLLDRLRDAGLAPVFIVDELDKVEGLSERILDMIKRLKKLVAENACFCFLADRNYFEEMRRRTALAPYSIEHTYFTYQFFISVRHSDVRKYLQQILVKPEDDPKADPKVKDLIKEEVADYEVLPYILMHNAQLHPIDLQRQITAWRNDDGNVILRVGVVRSDPRYRLEFLIQLAIEWVLEQDAMQQELDRRPAFRRLAHDAVYFISRRWEQDEETLSLAETTRGDFERYMIGRMGMETNGASGTQTTTTQGPESTQASGPLLAPLVSAEDLGFLWKNVLALAQLLASPETIQQEYERRGTSEAVVGPLREAVKALGPLFEPAADQPSGVFRWRFRRSGRPVPVTPAVGGQAVATARPNVQQTVVPAPSVPKPALWQPSKDTIRRFEKVLSEVTFRTVDPSTLSAGLGILPSSPAWPQVSAALSRLESLSSAMTTYPEMEDDISVVGAYTAMLEGNARAVGLSLYCASVLANWSHAKEGARLREALEKMSQVLALNELSPERVAQVISAVARELTNSLDERPVIPDGQAKADEWFEWISILQVRPLKVSEQLKGHPSSQGIADAWEYCRKRVTLWRQPTVVVEALREVVGQTEAQPATTAEVLRQAVEENGPFALLKLPLETMTLRDWSVAFFQAINTTTDSPPPWLAFAALRALGWQSRLSRFVDLSTNKILFNNLSSSVRSDAIGDSIARPDLAITHVLAITVPGAVSESWKPDPMYPALVLRRSEWAALAQQWSDYRRELRDVFDPKVLLIDVSAPESSTTATAPPKPSLRQPRPARRLQEPALGLPTFPNFFDEDTSQPIPLIVNKELMTELPTRYVARVRPKSLAEAVQMPQIRSPLLQR
jgi:hypothetical protein